MKKLIFLILIGFLFFKNTYSQQIIDTTRIFGVTIDDPYSNIPEIKTALSSHCIKPTVRIVFDEFVAATDYIDPITQIKTSGFIMGELLDSYYVNQYSVKQYINRATEYYNALKNLVDIWEIGNEVNGDWLGNSDSVIAKIQGAYTIIKQTGGKTAITLYFNRDCYSNIQDEMFTWIKNNLPNSMKQGLDYVLVSYYEDDCNEVILSENEWQQVFDSLRIIFPNSKLGMGECGTTNAGKKAAYMKRYYRMNITTPGYIEGNFWWYYKQDCVPKTKALWDTLNNAFCDVITNNNVHNSANNTMKVYPNPANYKITIVLEQGIKEGILTICNVNGQELIKQHIKNIETTIDIEDLTSGIYFLTLITDNTVEERKILKE